MPKSDVLIFDIIALEWLIALLAIALLVLVGGFVARNSRRDRRTLVEQDKPSGEPAWHNLPAEEVLEQVAAATKA